MDIYITINKAQRPTIPWHAISELVPFGCVPLPLCRAPRLVGHRSRRRRRQRDGERERAFCRCCRAVHTGWTEL